jgi:hypothetical protein
MMHQVRLITKIQINPKIPQPLNLNFLNLKISEIHSFIKIIHHLFLLHNSY